MAESFLHIKLVEALERSISDIIPNVDKACVFLDHPLRNQGYAIPFCYGFKPDLYALSDSSKIIVIGEAKTYKDLQSKHTKAQILSFLKKCREYEISFFIMAVPWDMVPYALSLVRDAIPLAEAEKVNVKIIEKLPY